MPHFGFLKYFSAYLSLIKYMATKTQCLPRKETWDYFLAIATIHPDAYSILLLKSTAMNTSLMIKPDIFNTFTQDNSLDLCGIASPSPAF